LSFGIALLKFLAAILAGMAIGPFMRSHRSSGSSSQEHSLAVVGSMAGVAWGVELIVRGYLGLWLPLELLLLLGLQSAVLALAACSVWSGEKSQAVVMATFLLLFSAALGKPWWLQLFVLGYLAVGIWWLMGRHWEGLATHLVSSAEKRFPRRWTLIVPFFVVIAMAMIPLGFTEAARGLPGLLPSSGGTGESSLWARGGVNDGDAVIAGSENVKSFAPIDDAPFMTSHDPSLYDLFDDTYSEPILPKNQDRAIALPRQFRSSAERKMSKSQAGGRPFSTLREPQSKEIKPPLNIVSDALAFVVGRVPLHLSLETFADFDGVLWQPEGEPAFPAANATIREVGGKPWYLLPVETRPRLFASSELHAVKLVQLDTNAIPSPPGLEGVMIDQLTDPSFYRWASPGRLRLDRERIPDLTVIHLQSAAIDERLLVRSNPSFPAGAMQYLGMPQDEFLDKIEELAAKITKGHDRGWSQIAAIRDYVSQHHTVDLEARPPLGCTNVPAWFLFDSQRGGDYHFASATALLLRAAGYPSRLVTGLYARDERYDYRLKHTPILKDDVHVWVEVHAGLNWWLTIESTPGYPVLAPKPTLLEQMGGLVLATLRKIWEHVFLLSTVVAVGGCVWFQRQYLAAEVQAWRWKRRSFGEARTSILAAAEVLESRLLAAGCARPTHQTTSRWLNQLADSLEARVMRREGSLSDTTLTPISNTRADFDKQQALLVIQLRQFARSCDLAAYGRLGQGTAESYERAGAAEGLDSPFLAIRELTTEWSSWRWRRLLRAGKAHSRDLPSVAKTAATLPTRVNESRETISEIGGDRRVPPRSRVDPFSTGHFVAPSHSHRMEAFSNYSK
jgi:transglutaminase-like putative cysteine protease